MAGDKKIYEKAVREGLNYAWESQWDQAITSFKRAQAEMPDDPAIHNHLGLAYLEMEQYESALEAYHKASRLSPDDPAPLTRIAEVHNNGKEKKMNSKEKKLCAI